MTSQPRSLFELLPEIHRVRDAERGGALAALLGLIDTELDALRVDLDNLYDNWFIETCQEWVVPYIGDLLGVRGLQEGRPGRISERALVANTIAYRRRKGTAAVLEDLARDVTGWPARCVEFFERLGWTQNLNHLRPQAGGTASLGKASDLELVDTAFDRLAHTADVRHIDRGRGRHNLPNVGLFLWRLGTYTLEQATARRITDDRGRPIPATAGCFRFNPLGLDSPLFNTERPESEVAELAAEPNVAGLVRRRALHDELSGATSDDDRYFAAVDPVLRLWVDDDELDPSELALCRLDPPDRDVPAGKRAAIDPVLGRIRVPGATAETTVEASWAYGLAGPLGGGPYDRHQSLAEVFEDPSAARRVGKPTWQRGVWRGAEAGDAPTLTRSLTQAVDDWHGSPSKDVGVIALMDSRTYEGDLEIRVPGGSALVVVAADWPAQAGPGGKPARTIGAIDPSGPRPHLRGNVTIKPTPGPAGSRPGVVVVDGLLIEGTVTVSRGSLGRLRLAHCTVLPDATDSATPSPAAIVVEAGESGSTRNVSLELELDHVSCGPVAVTEFAERVMVRDSILRGGRGSAGASLAALSAGRATIERSTLLGGCALGELELATDSIFRNPILVSDRQTGCCRYSYVPEGSLAPRRFRCRPSAGESERVVRPVFVSTDVGDPGYAQLHRECPDAVRCGASDGDEMGAFNFVGATQRLARLRARTDEYLRFGHEAGVIFVT